MAGYELLFGTNAKNLNYLGELAHQKRFCFVDNTKIPIVWQNDHICTAKVNSPNSFLTLEELKEHFPKVAPILHPNCKIGIWLGPVSKTMLCGIDLDNCIENGELNETAKNILRETQSYAEISPGGKGIHILLKMKNLNETIPAYKSKKIEIYCGSGRYFTLTLNHIPESPKEIREVNADIVKTIRENINKKINVNLNLNDMNNKIIPFIDLLSKRHSKFRKLLEGDISEYTSQSEADMALSHYLALCAREAGLSHAEASKFCLEYFRQTPLMREKWDEIHYSDGKTYGEATIEKSIKIIFNNTPPNEITTEDLFQKFDIWFNPRDNIYIIEDKITGESILEINNGSHINISVLKGFLQKHSLPGTKIEQLKNEILATAKEKSKGINVFSQYCRGPVSKCGYFVLDHNKIIKIDPETCSWNILSKQEFLQDPDVQKDKLRPYISTNMKPIPIPPRLTYEEKFDTLQKLKMLLQNLDTENFSQLLLYLFGIFKGVGPRPILILRGPPGSGKTVIAENVIQKTIEGRMGANIVHKNMSMRDFITITKSYIVLFDNQSERFSPDFSNLLCYVTTVDPDAALHFRGLFTDNIKTFDTFFLPIITTINTELAQHDFAERALVIEAFLSREKILEYQTFQEKIETLRPALLSVLLDSAAEAMYLEKYPQKSTHKEFIEEQMKRIRGCIRYQDFVKFSITGMLSLLPQKDIEKTLELLKLDSIEIQQEATESGAEKYFIKAFKMFIERKKERKHGPHIEIPSKDLYEEFKAELEHIIIDLKPSIAGMPFDIILEQLQLPQNIVSFGIRLKAILKVPDIQELCTVKRKRTNTGTVYIIDMKE